jgi:hypothetical protein
MTLPATRRLVSLDESHIRGLGQVLLDCVQGGASVSFMQPLSMERAERFWRGVADGVARGERALLVAEDASGAIVGTVQLVLAQPENQPDLLQDAADLTGDRAPKRGASCCHRPTRPRGRCSRASQRR